jgi:DinB superfamily
MIEPNRSSTPDHTLSARMLLRRQFRRAHQLLDGAINGLPDEVIHRRPSVGSSPIGASFAQIVVCEDLSINGVLAAAIPLALSTWAGRTGLSELPPLARTGDWRSWARRVRLDLATLRPYADAVYASTDGYLANLPDEALDPTDDAAPACLLTAILLTVSMRRGEIACLTALDRESPMER